MKLTKHILLILSLFALSALTPLRAVELKDASKAIVRLTAYDAAGRVIRTSMACYIDEKGTAAAPFSALRGAVRAEVTDVKGKVHRVARILGGNATADLVKFSTADNKCKDYFAITDEASTKYAKLYLYRYTTNKKDAPEEVNVSSVEDFNAYKYYNVTAANDSAHMACPLVDEAGRLVAIVQRNVGKEATGACAIDARFINDLRITSTSSLNSDLREILIPKALPDSREEALTYIYMMPSADTLAAVTACDDFVAAYPALPDGYAERAKLNVRLQKYAEAERDFQAAFESAKTCTDTTAMKADALHYNLSNLIYRAALSQADSVPVYTGWTLGRAQEEAEQAYAANPSPLYLLQKGYCQYAARHYGDAYRTFKDVCQTPSFASAETYFSAARSLELSDGDSLEVLALLDSCIAHVPRPVTAQNAQYFLERSQRLLGVDRFREAVSDYNEYEKAIGPKNLNERFYYLRSQAEQDAKMYQQALDDLRTAAATSKTPVLYRIEEGYLLLRVGEFESARQTAESILAALPENPDAYKILGIAQGETGRTAAAIQSLKKAKELGDDSVDRYLQTLTESAAKRTSPARSTVKKK